MSKGGNQSVAVSANAVQSPLTGRFEHQLDPKKRLTIPSGWRKAMGDPSFVYAMPDRREKCVNILPKAQMDAFLEKISAKALFDPTLNKYLQVIGAQVEQLDLDVQGRIRVSDRLLKFANLTSSVTMIGSFRMINLWNPAAKPEMSDDEDGAKGAAALDAAFAALEGE